MKIRNKVTGTIAEVADTVALPAEWEPVEPAKKGGRKAAVKE